MKEESGGTTSKKQFITKVGIAEYCDAVVGTARVSLGTEVGGSNVFVGVVTVDWFLQGCGLIS